MFEAVFVKYLTLHPSAAVLLQFTIKTKQYCVYFSQISNTFNIECMQERLYSGNRKLDFTQNFDIGHKNWLSQLGCLNIAPYFIYCGKYGEIAKLSYLYLKLGLICSIFYMWNIERRLYSGNRKLNFTQNSDTT